MDSIRVIAPDFDSSMGPARTCQVIMDNQRGRYLTNVQNGNRVRYRGVAFGRSPTQVNIEYGSAAAYEGILSFIRGDYLGGSGILFAVCTTRVSRVWENYTCDVSVALPDSLLAGTRDLWIEFSGGGPFGEGVGNFVSYTFHFRDKSANPNAAARPQRSQP